MHQHEKLGLAAGTPRRRPARVPTAPALGNLPGAGRAAIDLRGMSPDPDMLRALSAEEKLLRRRAAIEALIESAIEALVALDGDPDLEDDPDSCAAHDDDPQWCSGSSPLAIGDDTDAEPDDEDLGALEDEGRVFPIPAATAAANWNGPALSVVGASTLASVDPDGRPGHWGTLR